MTAAALTTSGLSESCRTLADNLEEMGYVYLLSYLYTIEYRILYISIIFLFV